jgi:predicted alpha/beta superfamily hydrolase
LDRDFEVFVILPRDAGSDGTRRYPALVVLDAIIELSTVAETVDRLAAAGRIPPLVVIGIGDPRREGLQQAAIRRFEEFAPPTDGYAFDDDLGRVFRSLFAAVGLDARARIHHAPGLRRFLVDELLPRLERELPIDPADLGLLGHSAGGTFTLYALHAGSPFRRYLALSPGIGVSGSWLLRTADTRPAIEAPRPDVYLSLGSEERTNRFNVIAGIPDTEAYAARLRARGDTTVTFEELDGETHSSVFPRAVAQGLLAIYGDAG